MATFGKLLRVDLTTQSSTLEYIPPDVSRRYFGGKGLCAWYLCREIKPDTEPLSRENKLLIGVGPLQGTIAPLSGRHCIYSKSPLTGCICDSYAGGHFGPELSFCGIDLLIIEGTAPKPMYLEIKDDQCHFRDASHLWGKDTHETEDLIREELDRGEAQVCSIGPAGENLVRFASIMSNKNNASARGGLGAVMGWKKLKAVAVLGSTDVRYHNYQRFLEARRRVLDALHKDAIFQNFSVLGTTLTVELTNLTGIFPTRNFREGCFGGYQNIGADALTKLVVGSKSCFGCTIGCNKVVSYPDPFDGQPHLGDRHEYETLFALGGVCGIENVRWILEAAELCNKWGLDTISAGVTVGFAMELFEKGVLKKVDSDNMELRFGDGTLLPEIIRKITFREGLGKLLAEGTRRAALAIGQSAESFAMHVKGMEVPGYDPRGAKGMGLGYATANRGACHNYAYTVGEEMWAKTADPLTYKGKALLVKKLQDESAVVNSAILCKFPFDTKTFTIDHLAELFSALFDRTVSPEELLLAGERIYNLERSFNVRAGIDSSHDRLPERFLKEPLPEGPAKGEVYDLHDVLQEYYCLRGWDENGKPTQATLSKLGLDVSVYGVSSGGSHPKGASL